MSDIVRNIIAELAAGASPEPADLQDAFDEILQGSVDPTLIAAFLMGLRMKGETVSDIVAGARILRANAKLIQAPANAIDTCGTGGLGWTSLNTSTAAAIVAASCGAVVTKHGNRSVPPKTGSADVLEALGVNLTPSEQQVQACLTGPGLTFLFAQAHHGAMRHVGPVRKTLGLRTIFNLLGPLSNPAGARRQVLGVFAPEWVEPFAHALKELGSERAWVVHGMDGIDELSISGTTKIAELRNGEVHTMTLNPEDVGLARAPLDALKGGSPDENASAIRAILDGTTNPFRDIVCLNAAASLVVSDLAEDLKDGIAKSLAAIQSGQSKQTLQSLVEASNG